MRTTETLFGRQSELARLQSFLAQLEDGPCGLFLEGEPGIGKTRLWRAALDEARERGLTVLFTRPAETEAKLGFVGLADLLGATVEEVLPRLPVPQRRALEVALLLAEPDGSPPDERAVGAAFRSCVRLLAATGPVLLAVDDVQWLDGASARALEFACRRLNDEPVGVLATVRVAPEDAEPHELARALGDERIERLRVGPLTVAAVYELVRAQLDVALSRFALLRIHEASGGNPFCALELARAIQRSGVEPLPGEPLPVTPNLRELVRARLALLPRSASETLLTAAALSHPTVALVERAVGSEHVDSDLESAVQAGVIELHGDVISFTHPLLASIPFSDAPPRVRRAVHRRLAAVVADPEERARHLALAAESPDARVAAELEDAATRACSRGAVAAAAELAEQAFRLTPLELAAEAHGRLLVAAEQHYSAGNTARAVELLEGALDEASPGSRRAELLWSIGKIRFEGQDTRVGRDFCRRALGEAGDDERLRARILVSVAYRSGKDGSFLDAQADVREAAVLAERLGDAPTLARAVTSLAHFKSLCGEVLETDLYERGMVIEEQLGGLELDYGPTAVYARDLHDAGEYSRARPLLERLCERGRASGDAAVNMALWVLADLEFATGNWERAAALAIESHDLAVQTGREAAEPRGLFLLALVEAARGEVDSARRRAEHALVLTDGRGWNSGGPRAVLGFLELSLENDEAAYEVLLPAIERYRSLGTPVIGQTFDAAEALAALGRVEEGRGLLDRCAEAPGVMAQSWAIAASARALGLLALAEDDLDSAQAALQQAVDVGERAGNPLELGRSLLALGTVQRTARHKQAARQTLRRALEIFDGLGALLWAERARRELGRIGGRASPAGELSATEAEIAELVAAGRSNKEVARALHLSPKTVEWNLSKIYRKLGVRSRTELAATRGARR